MDNQMFSAVDQVGFAVKDLDKTVQMIKTILGLAPYYLGEASPPNARYFGKATEMAGKLAMYNLNGFYLEFIQPVSGKNIYDDFMDRHGEGIHHIRFKVNDVEKVTRYMDGKGICVSQEE